MVNVQPLGDGDPRRLGDYDVTGRLGEGGQGVVYLGRGASGALAAVKLLHPQFIEDSAARARFVREVEVTKRVARFCTAQVLSAGMAGDRPYIVSEYVPGPSLQHVVRDEGPRRGAALDRLAINTATALAAIHRAGVVHRDFKPGNVLMGPDGPVVIDFGIARALDASGTMTSAVSQVVGTPAFMAPEQLAEGSIGPHTDMFAWAVTIVYAASGVPAFGHRSIPQVINRILHADPDLGTLDGRLRPAVAACLAKDPSRRPSARELMDELMGHPTSVFGLEQSPSDSFGAIPAGRPPRDGSPVSPGPGAGTGPQGGSAPGGGFPGDAGSGRFSQGGAGRPLPDGARSGQVPAGGLGPGQVPAGGLGPGQVPAGGLGSGQAPAGGAGPTRVSPGGLTAAQMPSGGPMSAHVPPGGTAYLPAAGGEGTMRLPGPPFPGGPSGGQGPPGPAGGPPEPKGRKPLIIGAVAALAVVVVGGVALAGLGGSGDDGQAAPPPSAPPTHRPVRPHAPTPKPSRTPSHRPTAKQMKHNPYTPQRVCGKGYRVVGTHALGEASTYLLYNKRTGANCVVTMVPRSPGKVFLSASLVVKGGGRENRSGNVPFYAGPIRLPARGKCVMWGGASKTARWTSGWSHCGK